MPTVWSPGDEVSEHLLLGVCYQRWRQTPRKTLQPHHRSRCGCSTSPPPEAPACRWGWGSAWTGSSLRTATSSPPARPGGTAAAPPAGETDSLRGQRGSPPTARPAEQTHTVGGHQVHNVKLFPVSRCIKYRVTQSWRKNRSHGAVFLYTLCCIVLCYNLLCHIVYIVTLDF